MRILAASIVLVPLLLTAAPPAAFAQSTSPVTHDAQPADRNDFTRKMQDKMQDWSQKVQHFTDKSVAKGQHAATETERGLNRAWGRTQEAAHGVQTATTKSWDAAKASFEHASRDLSDAWDKIRPEDR